MAFGQTPNSFRFAILGDRTGTADARVYEGIWREIDAEHPDFVINVGDTIEGGDLARAATEWSALRPLFAGYKMYFTPGNHDIWSPESEKLYIAETHRPPFYGFDYQSAHFTVLDNSRSDDLSPEQLAFLESDLKASAGRAPHFVFFHRPFWLLPLKLRSGEFALHRLARQYGVNYVISGHGHQIAYLERDGVVYLEVGSSGGSMARGLNGGQGFDQGWFYHHVLAEVKGREVTLRAKEWKGAWWPVEKFK